MNDLQRRAAPRLFGFAALTLLTSSAVIGRADAPSEDAGEHPRHARSRHHATHRTRPSADHDPSAPDPRWHDPVSARGQTARGLYVGASFVRNAGAEGVVRAVQGSHMNAAVIDVKDAAGRIHYDTDVPELETHETGWLGDARALVQQLHDADIYAIARIACFADRELPNELPDRAIKHIRNHDRVWVSWGTGGTWLDPYNEANHRMIVGIAQEAQALGFDEVQLDYVRFPVDDGTQYAYYPAQTEENHADVLMRLLRSVDEALTIPIGVDVFGLAAYRRGNPSGLGQDLERWTRHVEVFSPMLYVNSMRAWRRGEDDRAFNLVYDGVSRLRERVGERPVIRPFLQAFERGADDYGPGFIDAQVRAARRGHADGFLFWHPGITYGVVRQAMRHRTRRLVPFPIDEDLQHARSRPHRVPLQTAPGTETGTETAHARRPSPARPPLAEPAGETLDDEEEDAPAARSTHVDAPPSGRRHRTPPDLAAPPSEPRR